MPAIDTETLLTVDEYFHLPGHDCPTELVRGRIVESSFPGFRHGVVCANVGAVVSRYLDESDIGRTVNNTGVVTTHDPDSVRGADVSFYSYDRLPELECPEGYPDQPPELIFDVLWHEDCWMTVLTKVGEFLSVGVDCVAVLDTDDDSAHVFTQDKPPTVLQSHDGIELPDILPGFSMTVTNFMRR